MKISIIGSGNVATHLGKAFYNSGHEITEIYSPSPGHAEALARQVGAARAIMYPADLGQDSDLCLIAIKDDAIDTLAKALHFRKTIVVHTAGSISMEVLSGSAPDYGVFYPFQTFSRFRDVDISRVPFCIEASSDRVSACLGDLAGSIRAKTYEVGSEQRKTLHLAAVLASNFSNHLYALADELLREKDLSFDLLRPLIGETAEKVLHVAPFDAQTGPAVRNDRKVIREHLRLLEGKPGWQELYSLLSASIFKLHKIPNI